MQVFTGNMNGSAAVAESIASTIADAICDNIQTETTPSITSLPEVSQEKIIRVWEQLAHGTYNVDERLDAILERILMDINP